MTSNIARDPRGNPNAPKPPVFDPQKTTSEVIQNQREQIQISKDIDYDQVIRALLSGKRNIVFTLVRADRAESNGTVDVIPGQTCYKDKVLMQLCKYNHKAFDRGNSVQRFNSMGFPIALDEDDIIIVR